MATLAVVLGIICAMVIGTIAADIYIDRTGGFGNDDPRRPA